MTAPAAVRPQVVRIHDGDNVAVAVMPLAAGSEIVVDGERATVLLFTTGRGTPLGFPVPTIKISSNSDIAAKKPHWIDFNAGALLDGTATMDRLEEELFSLVLEVASGRTLTNNEKQGYREIAIWKEGVTL